MKYALTLIAGVWLGLAFTRIPHFPIFRDEPKTPPDHKIKEHWYIGGRRVDKSEYDSHYFNGGKA